MNFGFLTYGQVYALQQFAKFLPPLNTSSSGKGKKTGYNSQDTITSTPISRFFADENGKLCVFGRNLKRGVLALLELDVPASGSDLYLNEREFADQIWGSRDSFPAMVDDQLVVFTGLYKREPRVGQVKSVTLAVKADDPERFPELKGLRMPKPKHSAVFVGYAPAVEGLTFVLKGHARDAEEIEPKYRTYIRTGSDGLELMNVNGRRATWVRMVHDIGGVGTMGKAAAILSNIQVATLKSVIAWGASTYAPSRVGVTISPTNNVYFAMSAPGWKLTLRASGSTAEDYPDTVLVELLSEPGPNQSIVDGHEFATAARVAGKFGASMQVYTDDEGLVVRGAGDYGDYKTVVTESERWGDGVYAVADGRMFGEAFPFSDTAIVGASVGGKTLAAEARTGDAFLKMGVMLI